MSTHKHTPGGSCSCGCCCRYRYISECIYEAARQPTSEPAVSQSELNSCQRGAFSLRMKNDEQSIIRPRGCFLCTSLPLPAAIPFHSAALSSIPSRSMWLRTRSHCSEAGAAHLLDTACRLIALPASGVQKWLRGSAALQLWFAVFHVLWLLFGWSVPHISYNLHLHFRVYKFLYAVAVFRSKLCVPSSLNFYRRLNIYLTLDLWVVPGRTKTQAQAPLASAEEMHAISNKEQQEPGQVVFIAVLD